MPYLNHGVVLRDPGQPCPLHVNPELEIVFVKSGILKVGYDSRVLELGEGQFFFIFPYHMHSFEPLTPCDATVYIFSQLISDPYIKRSCILEDTRVHSLSAEAANYIAFLDGNRNPLDGYSYANGILSAFINSLSAYEGSGKSETEMVELNVGNAGRYTLPNFDESEAKIVLYIFDHMAEELTLDNVAKAVGWNSKKLSGMFKQKYDIKILDLISNIRVEHASVLLCSEENTISQIAIRCGFGSLRSFNRSFKAIMGVTPSQYRSKNRR